MKHEYIRAMPFNDYLEVEALHKSAFKAIAKSGKQYKHFKENDESTDAMRIGRIFHTHLLEPDLVKKLPIMPEKFPLKADHPENMSVNDQKKKWLKDAEAAGEFYRKEQEKIDIEEMAAAILNDPIAKELCTGAHSESSGFWINDHEIKCKTRWDGLKPDDDLIVEVKSTSDASPEEFGRHFFNMQYDSHAWFHRDGYRKVFDRDIKAYIVIVVEAKAPYGVACYPITPDVIDHGHLMLEYHKVFERYKDFIANDYYPDYNCIAPDRHAFPVLKVPGWIAKDMDYFAPTETQDEEGEL